MLTLRRLPSVLLSGAFVCALFLPLLLVLFQEQKSVSVAEKRTLAELPQLQLAWDSWSNYPDRFEKYFNDHFGGRDFFISLNNRIVYRIFHNSPSYLITAGTKDWLFFNMDGVLYDYLGQWNYEFSLLDQFRQTLEQRRDWLAGLGIHYIFLPVPNKMMVYDEYLPWRIRRNQGSTFYEQLLEHLALHSDFRDYINLQTVFADAKSRSAEQLYFCTDTHWNLEGSFAAQQAIGRHIRQWFPTFESVARKELTKTTVPHSGDLALMLHMHGELVETAPKLQLKHPCSVRKNKRPAAGMELRPTTNGCANKTLTALLIGDSFSSFLRPFLSESFKEITYVSYVDFNAMKDYIREHRPDVVIDQRVARFMTLALKPDLAESQKRKEAAFVGMTEEVVRIDSQSAPAGFAAVNQLQITSGSQGLELVSSGEDPYLVLPFDLNVAGDIVGELRINSPVQTNFQLFYLTSEIEQYSSAASVILPLSKGDNTIFFGLPDSEIKGRIRIDPGQAAGNYQLHSLILKIWKKG